MQLHIRDVAEFKCDEFVLNIATSPVIRIFTSHYFFAYFLVAYYLLHFTAKAIESFKSTRGIPSLKGLGKGIKKFHGINYTCKTVISIIKWRKYGTIRTFPGNWKSGTVTTPSCFCWKSYRAISS